MSGVRREDPLPRLPAVPRAVDPALRVRAEGLAEDGRPGDVRVRRVDDHRADLAGLLADVPPGLPGVGGLVDAVPLRDVAPDVRLARADVDDVRVGRRHRDRADRARRLVVEDGLPPDAAVRGLPHPARGRGRVVGERVAGHAGHARNAPARGRADQPVLEPAKLLRALRGLLLLGQGTGGHGQPEERTKTIARGLRMACTSVPSVEGREDTPACRALQPRRSPPAIDWAAWSANDDLSLAPGPRRRPHDRLSQRGSRRVAAGPVPPAPAVAPKPGPLLPRPLDSLGPRLRRAPGALPAGLSRGHRPRRERGRGPRARHLGRRPRRRRDRDRQLALPGRAGAARPVFRPRDLDGLVRAARGGPAARRARFSLARARRSAGRS